MDDLKKLEYKVYQMLQKDEDCRNSDNLLYLTYLKDEGIDVKKISIDSFYSFFADYGVARFESVARARRKIQELYPDLRACEDVRKWRKENETEFREYAISETDF